MRRYPMYVFSQMRLDITFPESIAISRSNPTEFVPNVRHRKFDNAHAEQLNDLLGCERT